MVARIDCICVYLRLSGVPMPFSFEPRMDADKRRWLNARRLSDISEHKVFGKADWPPELMRCVAHGPRDT